MTNQRAEDPDARDSGDYEPESSVVGTSKPRLLQVLGPGLITGASDDDPSGIATYSQVGAQFGYGLGWIMLFSYPLMCAVQMIAARIGRTTDHGIAGNLRRYYPASLTRVIVVLLFIANVINLGADLGAMGEAVTLLVPGPAHLYVVVFGVVCIVMQVFMQYAQYVRVLKWLTLALFAYIVTLFAVDVDWTQLARDLVLPPLRWDDAYLTGIVAVLGTTISPYLFFWQAAEEVEDIDTKPTREALLRMPAQGPSALHRIGIDTIVGMGFSNIVALSIIVTTAATLHAHGITDIQSSAQAAEALRPIAGNFAFALFAMGIVGTGLLAVPVLAGSSAYAIGEAMQWPSGLARQPKEAMAFYATLVLATLIGVLFNFLPIDPIRALYWSAVLNGVIAVPVMVIMMLMAARFKVMGQFAISGWLQAIGWLSTGVMALAVVGMGVSWLR
jgi:NRAMP (natural resistance-associated macrophage protein)-like metal ion transporter